MQICGVEIKGSEAIVAIVELKAGNLEHIPVETKRIQLVDDDQAINVHSFSTLLAGFMRDNNIEHIAIKKRGKKGEFAGGPTTFKIEGIFQLLSKCHVELISAQTIAAESRRHNFSTPKSLNKYQSEAFRTACTALTKRPKE